MIFIETSRQDRLLHRAMAANAELVNARNASRRGDHDEATQHVEQALNVMVDVIRELQFSDAVPRVNIPNHTALHFWLDMATDARLEHMAEDANKSKPQLIIDLLTSGVIAE